jgi:hypothetical protein
MSMHRNAAMAMVPMPVSCGPITRPMASMDRRERMADATLSASTQLGERGPGSRFSKGEGFRL